MATFLLVGRGLKQIAEDEVGCAYRNSGTRHLDSVQTSYAAVCTRRAASALLAMNHAAEGGDVLQFEIESID